MRKKKVSEAERQETGKAFMEIWTRFFPQLSKRYPRYPRGVSHYTTARGLLGISRSNALWATCAQYSNDRSEAMYGAEIAKALFPNIDQPERSVLGISLSLVREGQHGVVPYIELRPINGKLPITEVVCGPGTHESLTPKAVELLLARYGYSNFAVTTSEVPLRQP